MEWTQERLEFACRAWQKVLRLQDWDVMVGLYRATHFHSPNAYGETEISLRLKRAIIKIRNPIDDVEEDAFGRDIEGDLVHELVHFHFASFFEYDNDKEEHAYQEQAIEQLAKAYVSLKRFG